MTIARSDQVNIEITPYYHCVNRCVRRSFLCGEDHYSGRNFDHRKQWVIERLHVLTKVFAIDVCAYAIMSNHIHLVLHVNQEHCQTWDSEEIAARVRTLFPATLDKLDTLPDELRQERIELWRERLQSMSWFMRCLSEHIARMANKEDDCKGRFWEGRFKSQALLDEGAIIAAMAYVDLNPVRAGLATSLEDSSWTSIKQRLDEIASQTNSEQSNTNMNAKEVDLLPNLAKFDNETEDIESASILPLSFTNYIELVEWTGRITIDGKKGHIKTPPNRLLEAKGLNPESWLESLQSFERFFVLVGSSENIKKYAPHFARSWAKGHNKAKTMYLQTA